MEWDVVQSGWRIYLTYSHGDGHRHIAHFNHHGECTMTLMELGKLPEPTFGHGADVFSMMEALLEGAKRGGFLPDKERELSAELSGVKGELGYAKSITDRLLGHLLK